MSDINGSGYGDVHDWVAKETFQWAELGFKSGAAQTAYQCKRCGEYFIHYYHIEPDIFYAMEKASVSDKCIMKN